VHHIFNIIITQAHLADSLNSLIVKIAGMKSIQSMNEKKVNICNHIDR
jgi:hypothetical protein